MNDRPRAWVGCLACYNNGRLNGAWLDAPEDIRNWKCGLRGGAYDPLHEEFWVFDHENMPFIDLECSPAFFADVIDKMDELDSWQTPEAVAAWLDNHHLSLLDADLDEFGEAYCGEFESVEAYAEEFAAECGLLANDAPWPNSYIDWTRAARDLVLGGDIWTAPAPTGGVFVFNGHV